MLLRSAISYRTFCFWSRVNEFTPIGCIFIDPTKWLAGAKQAGIACHTTGQLMKRDEREYIELERLSVEIRKFMAETRKLKTEEEKMRRESMLYPFAVSAGLVTALVALFTFLSR